MDWENDSVVQRIVEGVAAANETGVTELEPLANCVDPDALESVFAQPGRNSGNVSFQYANRNITVYAHGEIVVR